MTKTKNIDKSLREEIEKVLIEYCQPFVQKERVHKSYLNKIMSLFQSRLDKAKKIRFDRG